MSVFYTILIQDNHSFVHSDRKRILRGSTGIMSLRFLVDPQYGDLDMTKATITLEYRTPISNKYVAKILNQSEELYKNKVEFLLPITSELTKEIGNLELTVNFTYLEQDVEGNFIERVRPIGVTHVEIEDTPRWSDYIPSVDLDNLSQIMMQNQAIANQNKENIEAMNKMMPQNLEVDADNKSIHLVNEFGEQIGDSVAVGDNCDCEDGIPVVDFTVITPDSDDKELNNVVEF